MNKKKASISILCANYNNSRYLEDFFKSIVDSTIIPEEIIIIDDCSSDNSAQIILEYQKKIENLILIDLKSNVGFANALNIGLSEVTKEYILRIDPDDILDINRIEKQWSFAIENPTIDVIGTNVFYFDRNTSNIIGESNFPVYNSDIINRYKEGYHGLVHGSILIKSHILKEMKYDQSQVPAEEYDLFSRILKQGYRAQNILEPLTYVRIHPLSASHNYPLSTFKKIRDKQSYYWDNKMSNFTFYRKYLMINFYRKSLTSNSVVKNFYKLLAGLMAPNLVLNKFKKMQIWNLKSI
jgi:glycosyltransferase involved in cell wall biosynthesis